MKTFFPHICKIVNKLEKQFQFFLTCFRLSKMSNWYRSGSEASMSPTQVSPTSRTFPTSVSGRPSSHLGGNGRSKSCMFCKSNGEDVKFYQSHNLKDDFVSSFFLLPPDVYTYVQFFMLEKACSVFNFNLCYQNFQN